MRIDTGQAHIGKPGCIDAEPGAAADIDRGIEPDPHRIPVIDLGDDLHEIGDAAAADHEIGRELAATKGAQRLAQEVITRKGADAEVGPAHDIKPDIHAGEDQRAEFLRAQGRRIGIGEGWKILVHELAGPEATAAAVALEEPAVVEIEAGEDFGGADGVATVSEPRHQRGVGREEILGGAALSEPEARREFAGIGVWRIQNLVGPVGCVHRRGVRNADRKHRQQSRRRNPKRFDFCHDRPPRSTLGPSSMRRFAQSLQF